MRFNNDIYIYDLSYFVRHCGWTILDLLLGTVEYLILIGRSYHPAVSYSPITTAKS